MRGLRVELPKPERQVKLLVPFACEEVVVSASQSGSISKFFDGEDVSQPVGDALVLFLYGSIIALRRRLLE